MFSGVCGGEVYTRPGSHIYIYIHVLGTLRSEKVCRHAYSSNATTTATTTTTMTMTMKTATATARHTNCNSTPTLLRRPRTCNFATCFAEQLLFRERRQFASNHRRRTAFHANLRCGVLGFWKADAFQAKAKVLEVMELESWF